MAVAGLNLAVPGSSATPKSGSKFVQLRRMQHFVLYHSPSTAYFSISCTVLMQSWKCATVDDGLFPLNRCIILSVLFLAPTKTGVALPHPPLLTTDIYMAMLCMRRNFEIIPPQKGAGIHQTVRSPNAPSLRCLPLHESLDHTALGALLCLGGKITLFIHVGRILREWGRNWS